MPNIVEPKCCLQSFSTGKSQDQDQMEFDPDYPDWLKMMKNPADGEDKANL